MSKSAGKFGKKRTGLKGSVRGPLTAELETRMSVYTHVKESQAIGYTNGIQSSSSLDTKNQHRIAYHEIGSGQRRFPTPGGSRIATSPPPPPFCGGYLCFVNAQVATYRSLPFFRKYFTLSYIHFGLPMGRAGRPGLYILPPGWRLVHSLYLSFKHLEFKNVLNAPAAPGYAVPVGVKAGPLHNIFIGSVDPHNKTDLHVDPEPSDIFQQHLPPCTHDGRNSYPREARWKVHPPHIFSTGAYCLKIGFQHQQDRDIAQKTLNDALVLYYKYDTPSPSILHLNSELTNHVSSARS
ncbi:hypothetical protein B0H11DRAFT_2320296 [Mycena galericulata]|nr:hypothetical protein B0H11DRAFT_2320296 [Mycena galericulata]